MPAKFDRCVEAVKEKGKAKNPYAVCRATLGSDADIRRKQGIISAAMKRKGKK